MLRSLVIGPRGRAPPQWRVIQFRVRERHWRAREQACEDSEEILLNGRGRLHALDDMRHWRTVSCWTFRRRRRTLIEDNPPSA